MRRITTFLSDEAGSTVTEYALLGMLIAVVIVSAVQSLGTQVNNLFLSVVNAFPTR